MRPSVPTEAYGVPAVERLYEEFVRDEASVPEGWRRFFQGFELGRQTGRPKGAPICAGCLETEFRVVRLIEAYRQRGHRFTRLDPVRTRRPGDASLDIGNFGLTPDLLDEEFDAGQLIGLGRSTLREIRSHLEQTYCGSIGVEAHDIRFPEQADWLKARIEGTRNTTRFSRSEKLAIFEEVAAATLFERFIVRKFPGQKSFSLSGCEALIPALSSIMDRGARSGVADFQLGMAHRGRLSIMAHVLRKPLPEIFLEFLGPRAPSGPNQGDVKYHKGCEAGFELSAGRRVAVTLLPNPSHLESVAPVALGAARARLEGAAGGDAGKVLPVLIHGDAAVSCQGVVYEVAQMAGLPGFGTGGSLHLVINNQIGFTTNYVDGRSSTYCTDVAKVTVCPVFHVNADDVEAVVHVARLAVEFRQRFHKDVFVDLMGYRRHGHNETDEPKYTQPLLYKAIEAHPDVLSIYQEKLCAEDPALKPLLEQVKKRRWEELESALEIARGRAGAAGGGMEPAAPGERRASSPGPGPDDFLVSPETGVARERLDAVLEAVTSIPEGFPVYRKIGAVFEGRRRLYREKGAVDWPLAELLALGSLLAEGVSVRLTGQDVERGTFSQRHAVITREDSEERCLPLASLARGTARCQVYNSPLSEYGVLGFEFGYSLAERQGLTLWEGQFGDFVNGAQVVIDNYLCCSRSKWGLMSGLVLLLPHGYEGQGSEHSSARLERFLQLCARLNMVVAQPTTPANFFHLLRRQVGRPFRLPLVVMTPKSLLRHPACVSPVGELCAGPFQEVLDDASLDRASARKVLLCSGKVYYELDARRREIGARDVAIVRLEQLYPCPDALLSRMARQFGSGVPWTWVQEEPANMGAWGFLRDRLGDVRLAVVSRPEADAPATGYHEEHAREQAALLSRAFEDL
ncbi:MAG: 2-oxoglutarate dehydrogenase E1 component [Elusimicrobia bacterium]|nr:2-oxoglutarate dehydrogenase E1 component [Elusimicrobiota bacterium]